MITTSAAQYVYQEKINYFAAQWFFVCIVFSTSLSLLLRFLSDESG